MAAADTALDVSHWQQHGGTVLQTTASNGRIRRTFVAPSGEKFRTWKECLKYMGSVLSPKSADDEDDLKLPQIKKRLGSAEVEKELRNEALDELTDDKISAATTLGQVASKKRKSQQQQKKVKNKKRVRDPESSQDEEGGSSVIDKSGIFNNEKDFQRPKRAASAKCLKEKRIKLDETDAIIESKPERLAEGEEVAIVLTSGNSNDFDQPKRKLLDFVVHDEDGKAAAIEMIGMTPLYISGLVLPFHGNVDKELAIRCEGFAVDGWDIAGYVEGQAQVWLATEMAEYLCVKPLSSYKKMFDHIHEKAMVCVEVYKALSKPDGGDPELGFDDLSAKLSRSFAGKGGQFFSKDYLASLGNFVSSQLRELDRDADEKDQLFTGLPAIAVLEREHKRREESFRLLSASTKEVSLQIRDEALSREGQGAGDDCLDDEKFARLLQEQEERKTSGQTRRIHQQSSNRGKYYIKINEDEIANDYPAPAFYSADEEEMDEYVLYEENNAVIAPEDLPRRMLHDWALYNCDSRLVSLELLPMLAGTEADIEIFGSGVMTEDDGSGYFLDENASTGISFTQQNAGSPPEGIRIYLSSIKEWMIEFGASILFISIRTDGAWYRLGQPSKQYSRWYAPVLKTARLAIHIISMLKEEMRVSRLSFADVVKRLAEIERGQPTFISNKVIDVERYVVVHGQIILQQFAEYPDEKIKRCAFVSGLGTLMEQKHHVKLVTSKKKLIRKGRNLNPRAGLHPDGTRPKPMRATTTKLINRIWSEYYSVDSAEGGDAEDAGDAAADAEANEQDEALEASDNEEEKIVITGHTKKSKTKLRFNQDKQLKIDWVSKSSGKTAAQEPVYTKVKLRSDEINVGSVILVETEDSSEEPEMLIVEYLFEKKNGNKYLHGRFLERGHQTVLGNAADPLAVFLTDRCLDVNLTDVKGTVIVHMNKRAWGHATRKLNAAEDEILRAAAKKNEAGALIEFHCRAMYCPDKGAFLNIPFDNLGLGTGTCHACELRNEGKERLSTRLLANNEGFRYKGVEYVIKDFIYASSDVLPPLMTNGSEPVEKFKASRNRGLRAYVICQLLGVKADKGLKQLNGKNIRLSVRRFFRPEDISAEKAYTADMREVYYSEVTAEIALDSVMGKCEVQGQLLDDVARLESFNHVFFCTCIFDPKKGTIKQLPANVKLSSLKNSSLKGKSAADEIAIAKRKGKAIESEEPVKEQLPVVATLSLSSLDIFAGCGGLSEGLHQSGAAMTKWAIEYEHPAAEAFKLNHPEADVFCENCNVILRSVMEKVGDLEDCLSTPEAESLCLKLSEEQKAKLPIPGEVDLIVGGPPCQGFSGMNRFNQRTWSKVQCEMILSFLSFADYFRPRYFLLENVRNFVSFNKGQTFRLTLASLLEMGYQVRFGVLQAGNYGVSQSRKRAFIWAASPEESLPDWPEAQHVFASSQLDIVLPGGLQYAAVKNTASGAPLRPITVRDTIADLPPVGNGADKLDINYGNPPQSWFQKVIRGQENHLYDHISKEMNELNHIRCQRIPKRPGSDWRDLPEEKVKLSTGQLVDLIPWCLPNTAERHNQWKGLFGRLDWEGNFPTSVTDPQPMGKVGMCFHPEQDRIVTVRECARSQGFPDSYKFYGNIQCKHRQIGNAVPPPLARALGEKLKEVVNRKKGSC
ncbi:hypothetical protein L7F22_016941 [Adiantum nelumboides]|nr:hypothetical protein [Adiantum nelumboides]